MAIDRPYPSRYALALIACFCAVAICTLSRPEDGPSTAPLSTVRLMASQDRESSPSVRTTAVENLARLPLSFEANHGQTDTRVKFLSRGKGYTLFLTTNEAVLSLPKTDQESVLRMKLVGANPASKLSGLNELPGKSNYFIGNDPSQWRTNVPNYSKVEYQQAYPGVDLIFYGNPQDLEYDFVLAPGADPKAITLDVALDTSSKHLVKPAALHLDDAGDLVITANGDDLRFKKPVIYQRADADASQKHLIDGRWVLKGGTRVGFEVASYDRRQKLIIDPALSYSTYLGGSAGDVSQAVAADSSGNLYSTGVVQSTDFPTMNPLQTAQGGHGDAFVTKLNPSGTALVYSTYLGGSALDGGFGIAVDAAGNAYIGGDTGSRNFPTTVGAFQRTCSNNCANGATDVFVTVLNPSGSAMVYSTFLGGSGTDRLIEGITVDGSGHAYLTGWTTSKDFPVTAGAFQTKLTGTQAGFVAEFNPTGSGLVYSTYLGGSNSGVTSAIAVDSMGDAYVTGWTSSTDFPTTPGAYQTSYGGGTSDSFVTELNPSGTGIIYSTYFGGNSSEIAYGVSVNSSGNAYITGFTCSPNFPVTAGALQTTYKSTNCTEWGGNGFISELAPNFSSLVYSSYLGGTGSDVVFNLALDNAGVVYLTGRTNSANFPTTATSFQPKYAGGIDAFFTEVAPNGASLKYSTFIGGTLSDAGYVIALDPAGNAYVGGRTYSTNFPVTPGSFQTAIPGTFSAMLFKFSPGDQVWPLALNFGGVGLGSTSSPLTTTLTNSENTTLSISNVTVTGANSGDFHLGSNTCGSSLASGVSCTISLTFAPTALGSRNASLVITDSAANSPQKVALSGSGSFVSLAPSSVTFATQLINTVSPSKPLTLTNGGTTDITITNFATTAGFNQTNNCGSTLTAGNSCTINVAFRPTAAGLKTGTLTVTDSSGKQTASLSGTGTVISFSPTKLTFSPQTVKTSSAPQSITMTNAGTAAVTINKIGITGLRVTSFSETNNCPTSLTGGSNCTISVTFTPQLKGSLTANVSVADTGGGSPQVVPLSGTGQ